ncbi:MAG TPA: protein kinase [Gemmataceae bacterium]|jgi:serine/threonine protein kinase|nr:protein kinase [Gemmataceae bacterium]
MQALKTADSEPIPGYRLIEPLGSGGFGEVWKCEAPGGLFKAIKFVHGGRDSIDGDGAEAEQELRALQHVKAIRHPFLLSMERVEVVDGDLVIVMELADKSLHDLLTERRAAGQPGIDRQELLRYLEEAAEVLDLMNQEYGLQHLDIKPRNLFLVGRHIKVADFGLVNSLAELHGGEGGGLAHAAITPLYAAPETFLGKITLYSDQYSLAISYQEMLTGTFPFAGKNSRQLALLHMTGEPDLTALPEADRAAVARALSKEARERFGCCFDFVRALQAAPCPEPAGARVSGHHRLPGALAATRPPGETTAAAGPLVPAAGADLLAGYRFLECVGRAAVAETWRVLDPAGNQRLLKYVLGFDARADRDNQGLARLRALRHPALAPLHVLAAGESRVALVTDPGDASLAARLKACQAEGQTGLPREEVLGHLRTAAAALDELFAAHRLQHLGLSPRNVVLADNELRLLDFALAELVWLPLGQQPGAMSPRYCAPELFEGQITRAADQYSLALMFAELVTGIHPFRSQNTRALATPRNRGVPDLGLLPATDRRALLRALHADPDRRFPTCVALVDALEAAANGAQSQARNSTRVLALTAAHRLGEEAPQQSPGRLVEDLVSQCGRGADVREFGPIRYRLRDGRRIEHQCCARLVPGTAKLKLEGFREQWAAEVKTKQPTFFAYKVRVPGSLWQRCMGGTPHLEVQVRLWPPGATSALTPVSITIEPVGCTADKAAYYLAKIGPQMLQSARNFLQPEPSSGQERQPFEGPVHFHPLVEAGKPGEPVAGQARALWRVGMSLVLPTRPAPNGFVQLRPDAAAAAPLVPVQVQRAEACPRGFEVDLGFVGDEFSAIQ